VSTRADDPDAPYLPERYRQQVRAKKQRRIYKKLVIVAFIIVALIVAYLLVSSMLPVSLSSTPGESLITPTPAIGDQIPVAPVNVTVVVTPQYAMGTGISALYYPELLSMEKAVSYLREDYPANKYILNSLNLTDQYPGRMVYEFTIQPAMSSSTETPFTVFEDALTGQAYTREQESARVTQMQAQDLARKAFPAIQPDRVKVRYNTSPDTGKTWNFALVKGTNPILTGSMDADTGIISSFSQKIQKLGRPAEPVLGMPAARIISEEYISDQNGPVAINISDARYSSLGTPSDPLAGQYSFSYNRIVNNIPCEADGFVVGVDSVTGDITSYERHWSAPDNAFSVATEPLILKREATFTVLQKAKETYPDSVDGLRIVSAEISWKDQHPAGFTPRPGSIPLTWKVMFDDDIIRANNSLQPAVAWVDGQTGNILDFTYRH